MRERWIICWRPLRSTGIEVVPCLFSLLPETTNTLNSLVMELQQEVCCGAGYFCRKGLKEPTHTWSWPSERGGIAGKTPLMGED